MKPKQTKRLFPIHPTQSIDWSVDGRMCRLNKELNERRGGDALSMTEEALSQLEDGIYDMEDDHDQSVAQRALNNIEKELRKIKDVWM